MLSPFVTTYTMPFIWRRGEANATNPLHGRIIAGVCFARFAEKGIFGQERAKQLPAKAREGNDSVAVASPLRRQIAVFNN